MVLPHGTSRLESPALYDVATCISAVENALESILEAVISLQILEIKYWISVSVTLKEICQNWMLLEMYL